MNSRRGPDEAGYGAVLRSDVFDLRSTQRQVARGSGPEQIQADRSIWFDQLAASSTRRRRCPGEAGYGAVLRSVVFDLGSTQRQVARGSGPEQLQADRSIGLGQMATSLTGRRRGPDKAGHSALLHSVGFDLGSTQRQVVHGSGPEQLQADRKKGLNQLATSKCGSAVCVGASFRIPTT